MSFWWINGLFTPACSEIFNHVVTEQLNREKLHHDIKNITSVRNWQFNFHESNDNILYLPLLIANERKMISPIFFARVPIFPPFVCFIIAIAIAITIIIQ